MAGSIRNQIGSGTSPGSAGTLGTKNLPRAAAFYADYFRDLDGNKLSVFCMG
ncbi:MAG: hypothetical protein IPO58_16165 [Betaproteobacteria bacterium]|nr:hypothetical protein [Betaproteobacteria bacterium]